jgi:hypothetical protein
MNNQQLFDNFSNACIYWARNNGDSNTFDIQNFTLSDNGTGNIVITSWNGISPQPTNAQLKTITLIQATSINRLHIIQAAIANSTLLNVTSNEIANSIALSNPVNGLMVLNTTLNTPQIYVNGGWHVFTII